jgi:hypothetical protein
MYCISVEFQSVFPKMLTPLLEGRIFLCVSVFMLKLSAVLETCVVLLGSNLCSIIDRVDDNGGVRITKRRTNILTSSTIHISNIQEASVNKAP